MIRSNFEPGRWLLVSGVILSVVLMLQLYAINETVDVSSIDSMLGENLMGLLLIASYLLTTVAMITVVLEYFSVKKKVDGLLALTQVLNLIEDLQYPAKPREIDAEEVPMARPQSFSLDEEEDLFEPEILKKVKPIDPMEQAFAALDDEEVVSDKLPETVPSGDDGYKAIEVKMMEEETDHLDESEESSEPEPLPEVNVIKGLAKQDVEETEDEVEGMLQQSEVISTLTELERVVEELRTKKPKVAAT
ncbi:MAG TPA: hypothetical protein VMW03_08895 [Candidatus Krumholzibacteriaceae bacterium]|nr:hypothetical protein [Candidatus Krumholzibacteriaceae bacterium]